MWPLKIALVNHSYVINIITAHNIVSLLYFHCTENIFLRFYVVCTFVRQSRGNYWTDIDKIWYTNCAWADFGYRILLSNGIKGETAGRSQLTIYLQFTKAIAFEKLCEIILTYYNN